VCHTVNFRVGSRRQTMKTNAVLLVTICTISILQSARADLTQAQLIKGMRYVAYATTDLRKNAKVCFTKDPNKAHINVHLIDSSLGADRTVCITDSSLGADMTIHFTDSSLGASRTVMLVDQEDKADIVIFLNSSSLGADYTLCISDSSLGADLTVCFSDSSLGADETIHMK
jgi:hypothetical protein